MDGQINAHAELTAPPEGADNQSNTNVLSVMTKGIMQERVNSSKAFCLKFMLARPSTRIPG